jgi:hypothetical protein
MIPNRSIPDSVVVPELVYPDVIVAAAYGATIVRPPTDFPFGERPYTAEDPVGHVWTFSQRLADADPAHWGGVFTP